MKGEECGGVKKTEGENARAVLCACAHILMCVFNFFGAVGIPLRFIRESVMSLMNTMCLSSLCTWEKFIRSPLLKVKTAPRGGLSLYEID